MYNFKKESLFQTVTGKPAASEAAGQGQGWRRPVWFLQCCLTVLILQNSHRCLGRQLASLSGEDQFLCIKTCLATILVSKGKRQKTLQEAEQSAAIRNGDISSGTTAVI